MPKITADDTSFPIRIEYVNPNPRDWETGHRTGTPTTEYAGVKTIKRAESGAGHLGSAGMTDVRLRWYNAKTGAWEPFTCVWCGAPINCPRHAYYWVHGDAGEAACADGSGHHAMPLHPVPCPDPITPGEFWKLAADVVKEGEGANFSGIIERLLRIRYADFWASDRPFGVENEATREQHNGERHAAQRHMDAYLSAIGACNRGAYVCHSEGPIMRAEVLRWYALGAAEHPAVD